MPRSLSLKLTGAFLDPRCALATRDAAIVSARDADQARLTNGVRVTLPTESAAAASTLLQLTMTNATAFLGGDGADGSVLFRGMSHVPMDAIESLREQGALQVTHGEYVEMSEPEAEKEPWENEKEPEAERDPPSRIVRRPYSYRSLDAGGPAGGRKRAF